MEVDISLVTLITLICVFLVQDVSGDLRLPSGRLADQNRDGTFTIKLHRRQPTSQALFRSKLLSLLQLDTSIKNKDSQTLKGSLSTEEVSFTKTEIPGTSSLSPSPPPGSKPTSPKTKATTTTTISSSEALAALQEAEAENEETSEIPTNGGYLNLAKEQIITTSNQGSISGTYHKDRLVTFHAEIRIYDHENPGNIPVLLSSNTDTNRPDAKSINDKDNNNGLNLMVNLSAYRTLYVMLDTGSSESWVASSISNDPIEASHHRLLRYGHFPECSKDTGFNANNPNILANDSNRPFKKGAGVARPCLTGAKMNIKYISGSITGPVCLAPLSLGNMRITKQSIGLANDPAVPLLKAVQWDGIFGLSFPHSALIERNKNAQYPILPIFDNMMRQKLLAHNIFSYYLGPTGGAVTFGGFDDRFLEKNTNVSSDNSPNVFRYAAVTDQTAYWTIDIIDITLTYDEELTSPEVIKNSTTTMMSSSSSSSKTESFVGLCQEFTDLQGNIRNKNDRCRAIIDTGTYLTYVPAIFVDPNEAAKYEHLKGRKPLLKEVVATAKTLISPPKQLPTITFTLYQGTDANGDDLPPTLLTLTPNDYIIRVPPGSAPQPPPGSFQSQGQSQDEQVSWLSRDKLYDGDTSGIAQDDDFGFTFGQTFLRNFVTMFDRDDERVGFARSDHGRAKDIVTNSYTSTMTDATSINGNSVTLTQGSNRPFRSSSENVVAEAVKEENKRETERILLKKAQLLEKISTPKNKSTNNDERKKTEEEDGKSRSSEQLQQKENITTSTLKGVMFGTDDTEDMEGLENKMKEANQENRKRKAPLRSGAGAVTVDDGSPDDLDEDPSYLQYLFDTTTESSVAPFDNTYEDSERDESFDNLDNLLKRFSTKCKALRQSRLGSSGNMKKTSCGSGELGAKCIRTLTGGVQTDGVCGLHGNTNEAISTNLAVVKSIKHEWKGKSINIGKFYQSIMERQAKPDPSDRLYNAECRCMSNHRKTRGETHKESALTQIKRIVEELFVEITNENKSSQGKLYAGMDNGQENPDLEVLSETSIGKCKPFSHSKRDNVCAGQQIGTGCKNGGGICESTGATMNEDFNRFESEISHYESYDAYLEHIKKGFMQPDLFFLFEHNCQCTTSKTVSIQQVNENAKQYQNVAYQLQKADIDAKISKALAAHKEALGANKEASAANKESLPGQEEALAGQEESLPGQEESLAAHKKALAANKESLAGQEEALAGQNEALASQGMIYV
eukprot:g2567.t1